MNDPADLSHLVDIVVPKPIGWWPPAPGWWIVAAAMLLAMVIFVVIAAHHFRRQAYRRAALAELAALNQKSDAFSATAVSSILKRTALVAYPRAEVASLTGANWLAFLDRKAATDDFTNGAAAGMERAAFGGPPGDAAAMAAAARRWVNRHRAEI